MHSIRYTQILKTYLRYVSVPYQSTIFREQNMPGLKPIANDKVLLKRFHSL